MKILDEIIRLLQSPTLLLEKEDCVILEELMNEMSSLTLSKVKQMIVNQVELPPLKCNAASRKKIIDFLTSLDLLDALLIRWYMELHEAWSVVYPVVSEIPSQNEESNASISKSSLNRNSPDADALVDLMVMLIPRDKVTLKKMVETLSAASFFAGTGQFAYSITSFYSALSFALEAKSESDVLFLDSKAYPVKQRIEKNELKKELKSSLHAYRAFHFHHIVNRLEMIYKKAPEFYFKISSCRVAGDEIADIKQAFQNKTSPYYGDELLMFHLNKYVIIQDVLQLLSYPASKFETLFSDCVIMLLCNRANLLKLAPVESHWYSFFSGKPDVHVDEEKLVGQVYGLIDQLNVSVELKANNSSVS